MEQAGKASVWEESSGWEAEDTQRYMNAADNEVSSLEWG